MNRSPIFAAALLTAFLFSTAQAAEAPDILTVKPGEVVPKPSCSAGLKPKATVMINAIETYNGISGFLATVEDTGSGWKVGARVKKSKRSDWSDLDADKDVSLTMLLLCAPEKP